MQKDAVLGLITLAVAIAYYLAADAIPETVLGDAVGAAGLPKLYAYALAAFSLALIVRGGRQSAVSSRQWAVGSGQEEGRQPAAGSRQSVLRAAGVVLLGVVYIVIVPWVGYMPAIGVLIGATAYYEGVRNRWAAIVAVCGAAFFWLLFVQLLGIAQPAGLWPAFD